MGCCSGAKEPDVARQHFSPGALGLGLTHVHTCCDRNISSAIRKQVSTVGLLRAFSVSPSLPSWLCTRRTDS